MEWILILGLGIALYRLWRRVEDMDRRLAVQESLVAHAPVEPARSIPVVPEPVSVEPEPEKPNPLPHEPPASGIPKVQHKIHRSIARIAGSAENHAHLAAPPPEVDRVRSLSINFEELFGRQLPIWAGGITLAIAGFFLVTYAIDLGLLSPPVRVLLGFAFGALLLGGAFLAERMKHRVADPRVPQALAGAGIATLYACFYLAGTGYGLIGSGLAFAGLAVVTAGAVWLSFRFGIPCAVLGLVGGFAAPMMVASDEANLPVLSVYLALVSGGLALTGNRQQRPWLGLAALAGGLLWGVALLFADTLDFADQLFVGIYIVALGAVLPAVLGDLPHKRWLRAGASAFAALQMAILIDNGDYSLLTWGLFGLLAGALAFLGWREKGLREASVLAAAVAALLLAFWPNPGETEFALVATGLAAILMLVPLTHVWRGAARDADVVQLAGAAPAFALATIWHFGDMFHDFEPLVASVSLLLAAMPALAAHRIGEGQGWCGHLLEVSAAFAVVLAFSQMFHDNHGAIAIAGAAIAAAFALPKRVAAARTFLGFAALFALYPLAEWYEAGLDAIVGEPFRASDLASWRDNLRYLVPAVMAGGVVAWRQAGIGHRRITQAIAVLTGIGGFVAAHVFYKLVFDIKGPAGFAALGLAERTVWEGLLVGAALLALQAGAKVRHARSVAIALASAALAHFGWFTLVLHNPLWDAQAVGPVPVANLALASFVVAIVALALLRNLAPAAWRVGFEIAIMALLPVLAITLLRQAFSGSILTAEPMGQAEDLLRSLCGIVLAVGYLLWGARREDRAWRIGSLVLMLLAVGKVFLADAAVLDGLARIASFLALGFSLIGIGWFYSRILARPAPTLQEAG